ncbi:hemolysin family protein [Pseudoruminococcus massiliensis]|uniref:hemolysin family protein n=1 Tax=Pseudoruminococcus massiliensis TaxID=2086583 RepID=UPI000D10D346|nr:hemolysin family protein [Pseudoruminococcus massiliensis]
MDPWSTIAICVVLLLLSAFFSSTETAFSSVSKIRLKNLADNGNKKAKTALYVAERYSKALTTILVGNNIVNIANSALATVFFVNIFGEAQGTVISTVVITIVVLIFGEVLPKNIAIDNAEKICMTFAPVLKFLMVLLTPLSIILMGINKLYKKLARNSNHQEPSVTEDELKYIIESIEEEGVLEQQESELVQSALEFDEKTAEEILTPRVDMVAIDIDDPVEEITELVLKERYSRIPVYRDNIDKIIGVLHTRDYLEALINNNEKPNIEAMLQPAHFIYKTKKLSALLADFKYNKIHLAVVTDDYGGILGIVTMEDLLEQIVGEIWDEDEEVEKMSLKISDNKYEVSGDMPISDMLELFDKPTKYIETESNSVGGWALEQLANIPEPGEQFTYKELEITIREVLDQRILSMIIVYTPSEAEEDEE